MCLFKQKCNGIFQRRRVLVDGFPDDFKVNANIFVNQLIAHCAHIASGNIRMLLADLVRDFSGYLTDNLKTPNDGMTGFLVIDEGTMDKSLTNSPISLIARAISSQGYQENQRLGVKEKPQRLLSATLHLLRLSVGAFIPVVTRRWYHCISRSLQACV